MIKRAFVVATFLFFVFEAIAQIQIGHLKCECLTNPEGIDRMLTTWLL